MAIVKMKRLRLIAMDGDREALFRLLQRMGCVEVDEAALDDSEEASRLKERLKRPEGSALSGVREGKQLTDRALTILHRYAPQKDPFLQAKPRLKESELFDEPAAQKAWQAAEEIDAAERRIAAIRAERAKLETQRGALLPWEGLDLPLDIPSTGQVTIQLGTLPANFSFDDAQRDAMAAGDMSQLSRVSADGTQQYCLLICHISQSEGVLEALKGHGWSRANLREWTGTAADNLARIGSELEALQKEQTELETKLSGMGDQRDGIRRLADRLAAEVSREESKGRLLDTSCTFYLEGWIPAEGWPRLEQALAPYPCAVEVSDPAPEDYPQVPVHLKNNWLTRPLNMVTEMYSLPAYGSLDPNPLMAPFFILFYGIMMADMGYGLVMLLLGGLVLWKKRPGGTLGHLCGLLVLCGISTFIMGVLTGGFFGDFLTQLFKLIDPTSNFALPALFTPLNDTMMILIGAMCLGAVQIITGMAISFIKKLRDGKVMDAIWEEVTWWLVFAGLALAILGVTNVVLVVGGVMVVAGPLITGTGMGKLTGIFGSLYNHITGYFGDILSYSRLMALMLAGSVIAQVFNTLGAIPGNIIIFLIISFVGNALNFGLNLLGCYVHDLRLQCLEYFGKFYEDGGKPFRPLNMNTKYYNVVE